MSLDFKRAKLHDYICDLHCEILGHITEYCVCLPELSRKVLLLMLYRDEGHYLLQSIQLIRAYTRTTIYTPCSIL